MESRSASKGSVEALPGLPDHEVLKELGRGGMGVVYLATNKVMGRNEVLKVVNPQMLTEPGAMDRFLQEIRSAAQLSHPNIVTAHAVLRSGESLVLAMEHIVGENLYKIVGERGPLPVANACYYVHQVALGLQHAYDKGMVHRDIKPDNLMLARDGKKHTVKILDFGLAKATREKGQTKHNLTGDGKMMGTPDYIAPEQILDAAKADIRADIYSLGCTLYFLLAGSPPFEGGSLYEKLQAHMSKTPTSLHKLREQVPVELAKIVAKMMAKEVKDRYQKPAEVAQALLPFVKGVTQLAAPDGKPDPKGKTTTVTGAGGKSKGEGNTLSPTKTPKTTKDAAPKKTMIETDAPELAKPKPAAGKGKILLLLGGGLAFAGVFVSLLCLVGLWAGGVFRLKTPEGVLVVQVDQPNADVYVDGERMTVTWDKDGKQAEIRVKPGIRKVQVKKDGLTFEGKEIEVRDGDRTIFAATLTPSSPLAKNEEKNPPPVKKPDAEPPPVETDGFVALFNGKDKTGWTTHFSQPGNWRVENGILVGSGPSPVSHLYTTRGDYKDFHLRMEVRVNDAGATGVYFRTQFGPAHPPKQPKWLIGYNAKIDKNRLGGLLIDDGKPGGLVRSFIPVIPAGQWLTLEVIAEGNHIILKVDGKVTADYTDELRRFTKGHIALQQHGPQTVAEFRRIEIKELASPSPVQPPVEPAPKDGRFVSLFNGKDLSGWKNGPGQQGFWRVENAVLVGSGANENYLFTEKSDFKDFHLRVKARISHLGNSGVFFRAQFGRAFPKTKSMTPLGYEAQINSTHQDPRKTGSFYIISGVPGFQGGQTNVPPPPPGEWFDLDVIAEGPHFVIKVNGKTTTDFFDNTRRFASGHIALQVQNPQTKAEFATIEFKEILPAPVEPPITVKPPVEPPPKEDPFLQLFNGKDTAGWKPPPGQTENWRVEDGILMGPGKKASYLYSQRGDFKNFHLRAEARLTDGSNGGIYFRAPEIVEKRPQGYKVLLNSNELDLNKAGSLFNGFKTDLKPVRESHVRPGEWFTVEVLAVNNQTVIKINGKQVADFTDEKQTFRAGYFVLEQADTQSAIDFRKIEIRELGPDAKMPVMGLGASPQPGPIDPKPAPNPAPGPGDGKPRIVLNVKDVLKATDQPDFNDQGKIRGRYKIHAIQMNAGKTYVISLNSSAFDAYLRLQNPKGQTIAQDDDSGGGLNARIIHRCAETGFYRIIATTFDGKLGPYQLTVQESP